MMIAPRFIVAFVVLLSLAAHAEAGQMRSKHQPKCRPLLKQAIEIDTPDPRYWNAYYDCIGFW